MGKFRRAAEAAISKVEKLGDGFDLRFDDAGVELGAGARERFGLRNGVGKRIGGAFEIRALVAVRIGDGEEHATKTRAAHLVFRREIGAAEKRLSIGKQKSREWPPALAGDGANGRLIARVHVGTLIAVHFHRDEMLVDDFGDFRVFVAFAVNDVAPVAPNGPDVEEDGLVFGFGAVERGVSPFVPVDGLVSGRAQVRAGGIFQTIRRMVSQGLSQLLFVKKRQRHDYCTVPPGPRSPRSSGLRPANPSSWR